MFGFHVKVSESGNQLIVISPADTIMLLLFIVFTVWPLVIFLAQRPMPMRKVVVLGTITLLFYGYFLDTTQLTLDKATQTTEVKRFHWFHWTSRDFSAANIAYAYLATGSTTDRIVLQYKDGDTQSFSVSNQISGKSAAVLAINRFLGVSAKSLSQ